MRPSCCPTWLVTTSRGSWGPGSAAPAIARGKLDGREGADRSLYAVLEDCEVRRVQPGHRLPFSVEHRNIELNQLDAATKHRLVAICL